MNEIIKLAEQHILESESRLLHIDEMMAQAKQAHAKVADATGIEAQLAKIQQDRDGAAQELLDIRGQVASDSAHSVKRGEKVKTLLAAVGDQLEKMLGTIVEQGGR